jgi:protein involved in polysaccharide export with SLBB domain
MKMAPIARLILALACTLAFGAGARAEDLVQSAASSTMAESYKLGAGDKLRVTVYDEDDLGGTFDIDGNGNVSLPLIGQMRVAGLSARDVEKEMTDKLGDGYLIQPRVNVEVAQYRPFYIIGEVQKPGQYPYVNDMNVLNAVALAGGYSDKAIESEVYVRRNGETKEIDYTTGPSTKIYPGDVVRIPTSTFWKVMSAAGPISVLILGIRGALY